MIKCKSDGWLVFYTYGSPGLRMGLSLVLPSKGLGFLR